MEQPSTPFLPDLEHNPYSVSEASHDFDPAKPLAEDDDCFYNLCDKKQTCYKKVTYGKFKNRNHAIFCSLFGLMCTTLLISAIGPLMLYRLTDAGINDQVVIDNESAPNYDAWRTNREGPGADDLEVTYSVYYFDIQNPDEILKGEQPLLVEVGPYTYNEYFQKFDITWTDGGDTVTYNTWKYYVFDASKSGPGLTEQDQITLPYPSVIGFQYLLDQLSPSVNTFLDEKIQAELLAKEYNISLILTELDAKVQTLPLLPKKKQELEDDIARLSTTMTVLFTDLNGLVARTDPGDLLLKILLCNVPSGMSPFFKMTPGPAWFGWLNDPVMTEVQAIINILSKKIGKKIPWSTAIPGASNNYTSIEDARRRRAPDTQKTGKTNPNQVAQYVKYTNMTHIWTCPEPYKAPAPYKEGEEFPACPHFQTEWSEETARSMGYTKPFATDFANRIEGTDGNLYGRPIRTDKIQIFISDIYRSVWLAETERVEWKGIKLRRFGVQEKDMYNATMNPMNAQYYAFGPTGLENATTANSVPVFISFPHFLHGDQSLVAAVKGLHPQVGAHETYLSLEPQTGLLVEARKRLQINYLMESYALPEISPESVDAAEGICAGLQDLVLKIKDLPGVNESALPNITCELTLITPLFTCLAQPSNWTLRGGKIFMPYGWVAEEVMLPDSDAEDLKNSLFIMDDVAAEVRFWSLIIAGASFCMIVIMAISMYYDSVQPLSKWQNYDKKQSDALGFTFNPSSHSYHPTTEPLLSQKAAQNQNEQHSFIVIG